jgi:hypothetical protein
MVLADPSRNDSPVVNQFAKPIILAQSFDNASTAYNDVPVRVMDAFKVTLRVFALLPLREIPSEFDIRRSLPVRQAGHLHLNIIHSSFLIPPAFAPRQCFVGRGIPHLKILLNSPKNLVEFTRN